MPAADLSLCTPRPTQFAPESETQTRAARPRRRSTSSSAHNYLTSIFLQGTCPRGVPNAAQPSSENRRGVSRHTGTKPTCRFSRGESGLRCTWAAVRLAFAETLTLDGGSEYVPRTFKVTS